jgi:hypothetical protein
MQVQKNNVFCNCFLLKGVKKSATVNVNYEDNMVIETKLYDKANNQYYCYTKVQWALHIRKEVFHLIIRYLNIQRQTETRMSI